MYAYIKGTIEYIADEYVVMDNHGIGYRLFVPGNALTSMRTGEEQTLYTHFAVREDALQLYGFLSQDDLDLFRKLLGVSGVGPKGALGILSVMNADDLRFAILSDDAAAISRAPGIGKKTAQKVILELKDKLDLLDAFEKKAANTELAAVGEAGSAQTDAVMALTALGYGNTEAMKAVRKAASENDAADAETLIKMALKLML